MDEIQLYRYFFEILIQKYLEIENTTPKTLTEKFDYSIISANYSNLVRLSNDYLNELYNHPDSKLILTLINATLLYIKLLDKQIYLNNKLVLKSQGDIFSITLLSYIIHTISILRCRKKLEKKLDLLNSIIKDYKT